MLRTTDRQNMQNRGYRVKHTPENSKNRILTCVNGIIRRCPGTPLDRKIGHISFSTYLGDYESYTENLITNLIPAAPAVK